MADAPTFMPALAFATYGPAHLAVIGATLVAAIGLAFAGRRAGPRTARGIETALAGVLVGATIAYRVIEWQKGELTAAKSIPLDPCDISALVAVFALLVGRRWAHELVWFWGIGGALPAVLMPDAGDFPDPNFFVFFIAHGGIVAAACYLVFGRRNWPTLRGMLGSLGIAAAWLPVAAGVNWLLRPEANYGYLARKPSAATIIDHLGPWPWYVLSLAGVAIALFVLAWLPFAIARRRAFNK